MQCLQQQLCWESLVYSCDYVYSRFNVFASSAWNTTHTTTVLRPFVRDYPGEPVPEETLTHPPSSA